MSWTCKSFTRKSTMHFIVIFIISTLLSQSSFFFERKTNEIVSALESGQMLASSGDALQMDCSEAKFALYNSCFSAALQGVPDDREAPLFYEMLMQELCTCIAQRVYETMGCDKLKISIKKNLPIDSELMGKIEVECMTKIEKEIGVSSTKGEYDE